MIEENNANVSIDKCDYSYIDVNALLAPLGGIGKYVKRGERVLLKVNLLMPKAPAKAVTTHPAVVNAVARAVLDAGAIPYIADSPGGPFTKITLDIGYNRTGIKKLATELGIELNYDTGSKRVSIPGAKKLKNAPICNYMFQADKIIALPKLKSHSFQIMTLASKIMFGAIPGLTKAAYHSRFPTRNGFADMLLDILFFRKPDLFIMDGVLAMEGNGPNSGPAVEIGLMLASDNAIALDIAVCNIIGVEPLGIPVLKKARVREMWPAATSYPLFAPEAVKYQGYKLPSTAEYLVTGKRASRGKLSPVPMDKCTACGSCEKICPRSAINIKNDLARVDYSLCIRCYCCHEICPEDAIKLEAVHKR